MRDGPISWASREQHLVSISSTEAEYVAATECCKELIFVKAILEELTNENVSVKLYVDNQSAIKLLKSGIFNSRTRHLNVRYNFVKETIENNDVQIEYVNTNDQIANLLTKPLNLVKFKKLREELVT